MSRKGHSITLSVSEQHKAQLEALALELGMTWGDRPNISKLVEAIARREIQIAPKQKWTTDQIKALNHSRQALINLGNITEGIAIAELLLEHGKLTIPIKNELEQFIIKPSQTWRIQIEQYIRRQQPFQLSYQDAAERVFHFHIHYAEITTHEEYQYLDCWCEESLGNLDIPELAHNWSLRLDRITDASTISIAGKWRTQLDKINIEMHLLNRLAFAYKPKTNLDIENEWLANSPQTRRVVREITSTFWFVREILRYGKDCKVIAPERVCSMIKQELIDILLLY
jgi:predicted DNA-binding transcriptional regulator YafY